MSDRVREPAAGAGGPYLRAVVAVTVAACLGLGIGCTRDADPPAPTPKPEPAPGPEPERPRPPRLVVLVVVDQLRGDELERHRGLFRYGLDRLLNEGRWYTRAFHTHARTETAAGHATIATGLTPRLHGVVDKKIFDLERGGVVSICDLAPGGCSPEVLREPTLGDRLKAHAQGAMVAALAQKAPAAMLLGGRLGDVVAWMSPWEDDGSGGLAGRGVGGGPLPDWLVQFHRQTASPQRISRIWELPRLPPEYQSLRDNEPCEIDCGHGTTFPHHLAEAAGGAPLFWSWLTTPDSDRAVVDMALKTVQRMRLGGDDMPDLLALSLGGFDAIGHSFGPDSLERVASFVELDRQLGDLLDGLTELSGPSVVVGLTSDHGVAPAVELARAAGRQSGRVQPDELIATAEAALVARFGGEGWVRALSFPFLHLEERPEASRADAAKVAAAALEALPVVHRAFPNAELGPGAQDLLARLAYESAAPGRSGDVTILLDPYFAAWSPDRREHGSEHGSPWEYDRHVPVILWGEGVAPARRDAEVAVIDLTRTLADRLGLPVDPRGGAPLP